MLSHPFTEVQAQVSRTLVAPYLAHYVRRHINLQGLDPFSYGSATWATLHRFGCSRRLFQYMWIYYVRRECLD